VDDTKVVVAFPGTSPTNREVGTFYYYTIDPSHGPAAGGNSVTIRGSGLKGANAVKFGTTDGTNLTTAADGLSVTVNVPTGTAGTDVDVKVLFPVEAATNSFVVGKYHYD
jgi:hypothetical protein